MFQDEGRFGRITDPKRCWAPMKIRPTVPQQMIREYTYAYAALSPLDGVLDTLILPDMYTNTMSVFMKIISKRHAKDYILMVMDGAPCHRSGMLKVPKNIKILSLPPYSPELNPVENLWGEIREKWFGNCVFKNMNAVIGHLVKSLIDFENDPKRIIRLSKFPWIANTFNCSF